MEITTNQILSEENIKKLYEQSISLRDFTVTLRKDIRDIIEDDGLIILTGIEPEQYRALRKYFRNTLGV